MDLEAVFDGIVVRTLDDVEDESRKFVGDVSYWVGPPAEEEPSV